MRVTLALIIAAIACGGETAPRADSAVASAGRGSSTATPRADSASTESATGPKPPTSGCVSEGQWRACSIEKRLTDAGFVPISKGAAATGVFDVEGTRYALGPAELHVYLFASAKDRAAAVGGMDTVTVTRGPGPSPWSMAPTFISSNNLVAVLLSDNGRLIERVQLAITAGLPSAPH